MRGSDSKCLPISQLREAIRDGAAREIQARVADQFTMFFGEGLAVIGFEKTETAGNYLLGEWESH